MKKNIVFTIALLILQVGILSAQDTTSVKKGTIKVKKKGYLMKIVFDNVNYRLLGVDNYGNLMDSAVVEFSMFTTINGVAYTISAIGPNLSKEMQYIIDQRDKSTVLFFKNIKAKDHNGTIIDMPDFKYIFPHQHENED